MYIRPGFLFLLFNIIIIIIVVRLLYPCLRPSDQSDIIESIKVKQCQMSSTFKNKTPYRLNVREYCSKCIFEDKKKRRKYILTYIIWIIMVVIFFVSGNCFFVFKDFVWRRIYFIAKVNYWSISNIILGSKIIFALGGKFLFLTWTKILYLIYEINNNIVVSWPEHNGWHIIVEY